MIGKDIAECRIEIDRLDAELLRLLNRRAALASQVGMLKRRAGLPVCDPGREMQVLRSLCQRNLGPLDASSLIRIFRSIIRESRRLQQKHAGTDSLSMNPEISLATRRPIP